MINYKLYDFSMKGAVKRIEVEENRGLLMTVNKHEKNRCVLGTFNATSDIST